MGAWLVFARMTFPHNRPVIEPNTDCFVAVVGAAGGRGAVVAASADAGAGAGAGVGAGLSSAMGFCCIFSCAGVRVGVGGVRTSTKAPAINETLVERLSPDA